MKHTNTLIRRTASRLSIAAAAGALIAGSGAIPATAHSGAVAATGPATAVTLSAEEIADRLGDIADRYTEAGDVLSAEDAAFVRAHAKTKLSKDVAAPDSTASGSYSRSGRGAGASGTVRGSFSLTTHDFSINNSYRISYTARGSSSVHTIKACAHIRAYGLVGSGGIGVVYAEDPCSTVKGRTNAFSRGRSFQAFTAYSTIQYDARFYTSRGSFQIAG